MVELDSPDGDSGGGLSIDGDADDRPPARKRRRRRAVAELDISSGPLSICFVIASDKKHAFGPRRRCQFVEHRDAEWHGEDCLAGVVLMKWHFHASSNVKDLPPLAQSVCMVAQRNTRGNPGGFLAYQALGYARARAWQMCHPPLEVHRLHAMAGTMTWAIVPRAAETESMTFENVLQKWAEEQDVAGPLDMTMLVMLPGAVCNAFDRHPDFFYAISLSPGRLPPHFRCLPAAPPQNVLREMTSQVAQNPGQVQSVDIEQTWPTQFTADEHIEFLRASATCTSLRHLTKAKDAWETILKRRLSMDIVIGIVPSYDRLRRDRIRMDMMAMMMYRFMFKELAASEEQWCLYVFMDASPQWRGTELFAASIDVSRADSAHISRHLLPLLNLGSCFRTVRGKAWAFLKMLALIIGPEYDTLRTVLRNIRSITSDLGHEFAVRDLPDLLIPFLQDLGARVPAKKTKERWLLPLCIAAPGWHHLFDGLLRFGLGMLPWFPGFLEKLKALNKWLRNSNVDIVAALVAAGLPAPALLVRSAQLPHFAAWRWKTIAVVTKSLLSLLPALCPNSHLFLPLLFKSKDKPFASSVRRALQEGSWAQHFEFVHWLGSWVCRLEKWGSRCPCPHHAGLRDFQCDRKGRLLHLAWPHASAVFDEVLREVQEWQPERFDGDLVLQQQCEASLRATVARAKEKLHYLDRVPYLFARLTEGEAIGRRVLQQFEEVAEDAHHRVTLHFLGPHSILRPSIVAVAEGEPLSDDLLSEVLALQRIPLDDTVAEGPHAKATRLRNHARAGKFGWHAATQRLSQNLQDVQDIAPSLPVSTQWLWDNASRVANFKNPSRKKKLTARGLERHIYHEHGAPSERFKLAGGFDDEDDGDDPCDDPGDDAPKGRRSKAEQARHLFRQWLCAALPPATVFSVAQVGDIEEPLALYMVLEQPRRLITVEAYDHKKHLASVMWNLQKLEVWRVADLPLEPGHLEAFYLADSCRQDILDIIGPEFAGRERCKVWQPVPSDLDGCKAFSSPAPLRTEVKLSSDRVPLLTLIEEVRAQAFAPVPRLVERKEGMVKVHDQREPSRTYLQAVLASSWLWANGAVFFLSKKPAAYYNVLLADPKADLAGKTAAECGNMLKTMKRCDIEALEHIPAARPAAVVAGDVDGDDGADMPLPDMPPPAAEAAIAAADDDALPEAVDGDAIAPWPTHVCGAKIVREDRVTPTGLYTEGVRISCPYHGRPCNKYRSRHLRQDREGRLAAVFFLGAWCKGADVRSAQEHQRWNPSIAEVHEFMLGPECPG